jgi:hypothetical protein
MRLILPNWMMTIEFAGLVDEVNAGDLANLGGLHVEDALAAAGLEAALVDVGALAAAVLRNREDEAEPNSQKFPKWESLKNKLRKKWHVFRARILTINSPAFTSNPPQLHHKKPTSNHPFSPKPPAKTRSHHPQKITPEPPLFEQGFGFFRGMTRAATLSWSSRSRTVGAAQPAQTRRLPRMLQGCPKTPVPRSFSGERSFG